MMVYLVLGGVLLLGALLTAVYFYARGSAGDSLARVQAEALQIQERARRDALELAAAAERAARLAELNDKIASVRTADDAARLVRERLSRRRTGGTL